MNFPESSLANLGSLGYTEDEARFLYLVSTHSGYFIHAPVSPIRWNQERGQEHGFLPKTSCQGPCHSPLLSPQWSRVPPILPHRVPSHRPGKPSQPPCSFPRTHSHTARCPGLRRDAFAVRIP